MKKSRRQTRQRQQKRRRRQSRKPRISRGGMFHNFGNYFGQAMNAASICANTIRLVKNFNNSIETLTFCQRINTSSMNKELVLKFEDRLLKLKETLNFIAHNNVVRTIVSFAVYFFGAANSSSELQKLRASIPAEVEMSKSTGGTRWGNTLFNVVNAARIIMWGEGYNAGLTEATNNVIVVVTEMIALQIGLPMKTVEDLEDDKLITAPLEIVTSTPKDLPKDLPLLETDLVLTNAKTHGIRASSSLTRPQTAVLAQSL